MYPLFAGFKGGKAVATSGGVYSGIIGHFSHRTCNILSRIEINENGLFHFDGCCNRGFRLQIFTISIQVIFI